MRRLLFSLAALCLVGVTGCCLPLNTGICDCDPDPDWCCRHAPWCNPNCANGLNGGCSGCNGNFNGTSILTPAPVPAKDMPRTDPPKL